MTLQELDRLLISKNYMYFGNNTYRKDVQNGITITVTCNSNRVNINVNLYDTNINQILTLHNLTDELLEKYIKTFRNKIKELKKEL